MADRHWHHIGWVRTYLDFRQKKMEIDIIITKTKNTPKISVNINQTFINTYIITESTKRYIKRGDNEIHEIEKI